MGEQKRPKVSLRVRTEKRPRFSPATAPSDDERPVWRVGSMDRAQPRFGWNHCKREQWFEVLDNLSAFEKLTFAELGGKGCHDIPRDRLHKEARDRLNYLKHDDIDSLFSLRITGVRRVFCRRISNVLHLFWYDSGHHVCPAKLKHT